MEYLGCQRESGICDRCGRVFEYLHLMERQRRRRRFCLDCAMEASSRGVDWEIPTYTEARCRQEGGRWVSGEQGEKDYDRAQGENLA